MHTTRERYTVYILVFTYSTFFNVQDFPSVSSNSRAGAGDDGVSCAVMLELLRALADGFDARPFRHNLILLFNGAEENILQVRVSTAMRCYCERYRHSHMIRAVTVLSSLLSANPRAKSLVVNHVSCRTSVLSQVITIINRSLIVWQWRQLRLEILRREERITCETVQ